MERSATARSKTGVFLLIFLCFSLAIGWYWSWRDRAVSAAPLPCLSQHMSVAQGSHEAVAGMLYAHIVVRNKALQPCELSGYPSAFMLNTHGAVMGKGASADMRYTPTRVVLPAHGTAHAVVTIPNASTFDAGTCTTISAALRLYLPSASTPMQLPFSAANCPGFSITVFKLGE